MENTTVYLALNNSQAELLESLDDDQNAIQDTGLTDSFPFMGQAVEHKVYECDLSKFVANQPLREIFFGKILTGNNNPNTVYAGDVVDATRRLREMMDSSVAMNEYNLPIPNKYIADFKRIFPDLEDKGDYGDINIHHCHLNLRDGNMVAREDDPLAVFIKYIESHPALDQANLKASICNEFSPEILTFYYDANKAVIFESTALNLSEISSDDTQLQAITLQDVVNVDRAAAPYEEGNDFGAIAAPDEADEVVAVQEGPTLPLFIVKDVLSSDPVTGIDYVKARWIDGFARDLGLPGLMCETNAPAFDETMYNSVMSGELNTDYDANTVSLNTLTQFGENSQVQTSYRLANSASENVDAIVREQIDSVQNYLDQVYERFSDPENTFYCEFDFQMPTEIGNGHNYEVQAFLSQGVLDIEITDAIDPSIKSVFTFTAQPVGGVEVSCHNYESSFLTPDFLDDELALIDSGLIAKLYEHLMNNGVSEGLKRELAYLQNANNWQ